MSGDSATGDSGDIVIDVGSYSNAPGAINIGTVNATNITVGGSSTGILLGGSTTINGLASFAGGLQPTTNDSFDIGDNTHRWANLFLGGETLRIGTATNDEGARCELLGKRTKRIRFTDHFVLDALITKA